MPDLQGQKGELRMTVEITRAATGKVETYELIGHTIIEENEEEEKEDGE